MNKFFWSLYTLLIANCQLLIVNCYGQEIPLGTWRLHNSYNSIHTIANSVNNTFGASSNGIVMVNTSDQSISALSKMDGLSGGGITAIAYHQAGNQLIIAYEDGIIDIVRQKEIIQYTTLKNSTTISGSRRINQINIKDNLSYLSSDFGVVVFDLQALAVKETWRDLGVAGASIKIYQSAFLQDSIFLATEKGVLGGDLRTNLLDFANWKRFNTGAFSGSIQAIAAFNNKVFAAINGSGLHVYANGLWSLDFFSGSTFKSLSANQNLMVVESAKVWKISSTGTTTPVSIDLSSNPVYATEDAIGKIWVGDGDNGILSDVGGSFQSIVPNGPTFSGSFRLRGKNVTPYEVYAVSGGYTSSFTPAGNSEYVNLFTSGLWSQANNFQTSDITDIDFSATKTFIASFISGLQVVDGGVSTLYTENNSPLINNRVSAVAASPQGLWVANYGSFQPLHLLKNDNTWQSFSFPVSATQYPTQLLIDNLGQVWMALNPALGGGLLVYSLEKNQHVYLTDATGSGQLPNRSVYSLASDLNGQVWVGTGNGVAYFPSPSQVFSGNINSVKPIFSGRFLLRDETITALAVDGGNRKWMGTQRGVWLFDSFGEREVYNFNAGNSPLLSDKFSDIEINPVTGEVFFATEKGIISFRADATASTTSFAQVKIFPNPVTNNFAGEVSISGLATDAIVKITDISGKLIWQTQANGGTATWNVRDYNGKRASTGMYLVIAIAQNASESIVGKIAVVN